MTAAHCLPSLPTPPSDTADRTHRKLIGPLGTAKPTIWVECLFVDPVSDIALLGAPDDQELSEAYDEFLEQTPALSLRKAVGEEEAWHLALEGERWFRGTSGV